MSVLTEKDTLLPRDRPCTRSSARLLSKKSISNVPDREGAEGGDHDPNRNPVSNIMALLFGLAIFFVFLYIILTSLPGGYLKSQPEAITVEQRVQRILKHTPLIDGHNDLAIQIRVYFNNQVYDDKFKKPFENGGMVSQVDLPRLRQGMNGGAFWSAFVPCPVDGKNFSNANYHDSVAFTLTQIDLLTRLQAAYPKHFSGPHMNSSTALQAFKSGQLISPIIIEGLHQIGNSLSNLRHYHSLGVRYATLTHNCHNKYADAALLEVPNGIVKSKPYWSGVSDDGRLVIQEMNRLGMIVDLAHVSQDTMHDVLAGKENWTGSAAPIIFSHSSAYSICPHPRNVPDDILHLVAKTNSLVMINFSPDFVSCVANPSSPDGIPTFYPQNATLEHVVTHIMYIGDLIGYDHVGLGSDFDGIPTTPKGLEDVSKFPDLVAEMLRRGVSDDDAKKVVGGNILRVWRDVDEVALKMQKVGVLPVEDKLKSLFGVMDMSEMYDV